MSAERPEAGQFRLIALDLDGTLLNNEGRVSQADAAALKQFARAGGIVALASGRMTDRIRPLNDETGTDGPVISYNGAVARTSRGEGSEAIFERPLPAQYADELIEYTRREGLLLNYYLDEHLYACDTPELRRFADIYSRQTGAVYHFVPDLDRFRGCEPAKCIIVTDPTDPERPNPRGRDELYEVWHAKWDSELTVMRTNPEYLEFYSRQAGKGNALEALARHYGVPRSLTIAFGDNLNDVTMLEWAGRGVAVANANPDAKAAADWVSPLTNDESPVADALRRMLPGLRLA
jgi:Cof subfamily protein (haloacid dehalogenase superfamily)